MLLQAVPFIDLALETTRQVVVDREKGVYLGHPTTVLLEDGKTMICVYPRGHGKGPILLKRSEDGGKTWGDRQLTPDNWVTSLETPTIHRIIEPVTGHKRLVLWSGLYPARFATSDDDGTNWSPLQKAGDWGGIVVMSSVEQLRDGRYVALFHDDGRFFTSKPKQTTPPTFTLYQTFSADGGLSWGKPQSIWSGQDVNLCEPGIIRSPDGRTLAILLRENRRVKNSQIMFSSDEAKTWSKPKEMPASLIGDRHVGKYSPDGRLVISFRDTNKESPTNGDWMAWVGTFEDLQKGRPGQFRLRLMDNQDSWDCGYPGVEVLPDGTFVCTTYGHWTKGEEPYVVSVRFRLDEFKPNSLAGGPLRNE